jgi:hypothetical protein
VRPAGKEPRTKRASIIARGSIRPSELQLAVGGSQRRHTSLQAGALSLLAFAGIPAIPIHTGPRVRPREGGGFELLSNRDQRGFSDVIAALPPDGKMLVLELKTGGAKRSPAQVRMHSRLAAAGAICLTIHEIGELADYIETRRGHIQGGKS